MSELIEGQNLPSAEITTNPPASMPLVLRGHQRALHNALKKFVWPKTGQSLADLYSSCLTVLETKETCKLQMTAHCMREILEKLQFLINSTYSATLPRALKGVVNELQQKWQNLLRKPAWQDRVWKSKTVDGALNCFLDEFQAFSNNVDAEWPSRRKLKANLMKHFSASPRKTPEAVIDSFVRTWDTYDDYFKAMSHNQLPLDEGNLRDHLDHCERFILGIIEPPTFEELDEIDALIKKGEA